MVAQLDKYLSPEETPDQQSHDHQEDPYEAEETLSLCDLPTHSDSAHWDDFSKDYKSSSFDRDEDNFFEFFSEEFTTSIYPSGDKDIIFCGKLIPYNKEALPHVCASQETNTQNTQEVVGSKKFGSSTKKWAFFQWRKFRGSKSKVVANGSKSSQVKNVKSTTSSTTRSSSFPQTKSYKRCNLSIGKVSILSSNRSKSKWHLFMFGMAGFPAEMELRDIKSRQSRRSPSTMFGDTNCEASNELNGKGNKGISDSRNRAKGLWGLLKAIGCSTQLPNAVVKAASFS